MKKKLAKDLESTDRTLIYRKRDDSGIVSPRISGAFSDWRDGQESILFVIPHDDDAVLGAGLMILQAVREGLPVRVAITTDGSMGYNRIQDKFKIVEIRRQETLRSFEILGIP